MSYQIRIKRSAQKALARIPRQYSTAIIDAIRQLSMNPRPPGCKKLVGRDAWRIRISNYRVIYEIEDNNLIVIIMVIGHRSDVYKIC